MEKQLFTEKDICKALKISRSTLYRWVALGLPSLKVVGSLRFDLNAVLSWVGEQNSKQQGTEGAKK